MARGLLLEMRNGGNLPKNFPTIDAITMRANQLTAVTSIKSMDIANSYSNAGSLQSKLQGHINQVANFSKGTLGGVTVTMGPNTQRNLTVAISGIGNPAQQQALINASSYASKMNVNLQYQLQR